MPRSASPLLESYQVLGVTLRVVKYDEDPWVGHFDPRRCHCICWIIWCFGWRDNDVFITHCVITNQHSWEVHVSNACWTWRRILRTCGIVCILGEINAFFHIGCLKIHGTLCLIITFTFKGGGKSDKLNPVFYFHSRTIPF